MSHAIRRPVAVRQSTPRVAILIDTSTDWSRRVISGIHRYQRTHGLWHVFIESRGVDETLNLPTGWQGDGVIARIVNREMARLLAPEKLGIPVVNVSAINIPGSPSTPRVNSDVAASARLAVKYFQERGFRQFGYLSLLGLEYAARQQMAFTKAVQDIGGISHAYSVKTHDGAQTPDWNLRTENLAAWLQSLPKPVAIFTWSGGREIIQACDYAKIRVPEEVAVLSGSDDFLCELSRIPISAVQSDCEVIGYEAAAMLERLMQKATPPRRPKLIAPLQVITRQSTDTLAITDAALVKALGFIRDNAARQIDVLQVAKHAGVSRRVLERRFAENLGRSPSAQIRFTQLDRVKQLLRETNLSIEQISEMAGFGSPDHMGLVFRKQFKITPRRYRISARGQARKHRASSTNR